MINGRPGMVRSVEPEIRERELHLVVQLLPEGAQPNCAKPARYRRTFPAGYLAERTAR